MSCTAPADDHDAHVADYEWHLRGWTRDGRFHEAPPNLPHDPDKALKEIRSAWPAPFTPLQSWFAGMSVRHVPDVLVRKGRKGGGPEWRWVGKAGAGYPTHPLDAEHRRRLQGHVTHLAKIDRIARQPEATKVATATREGRGAVTLAAVLALASQADMRRGGQPVPKLIAAEMVAAGRKISLSQVRRHIQANTKTRTTETG